MPIKKDKLLVEILKQSGSEDYRTSINATRKLAKAIELPLRKAILEGDIVSGIFERIPLEPGATAEYPLDLIAPGREGEFAAYVAPREGRIPERAVMGDYITVHTFPIANAIDWPLRVAREARWDLVARAVEIFENGFVQKINRLGWQTILKAGESRNLVVYDSAAPQGYFTKKLLSSMMVTMRRLSGGNTASTTTGRLTDVFLSPEALEDIRTWDASELDDLTRREIHLTGDGEISQLFKVALHDLVELGVGSEFQDYLVNTLGVSLPANDEEFLVGLDLSKNDSFVMPIKQELSVSEDPVLHRQQRAGIYGTMELGIGVLDNRRVLLGAL